MIQELINRADRRGYVTFDDVLEVLEDEADDTHSLEALLDELDELGIELRQEEPVAEVEAGTLFKIDHAQQSHDEQHP